MNKKNILLLALLSLGFVNSTSPEQTEQSDARSHIQFVQRVDDSIQRAEESNLPAGTIYTWMNNASALYYDGNELRTDRDLLARALKEGYARPFLLFGHVSAWGSKMSMLSKDRKYIPDLTIDVQDRVASFLYPDSKIRMYRYSVGESGLHLNGMDVVSQDITTEELVTLTQTIFTEHNFASFLSRASYRSNLNYDAERSNISRASYRTNNTFKERFYAMINRICGVYPSSQQNKYIFLGSASYGLGHNLRTNHSDVLAGTGAIHLFDSVKQNLVSDYVQYTTEARIWDEDGMLNSDLRISFKSIVHDLITRE